jgi:hypothetical protein
MLQLLYFEIQCGPAALYMGHCATGSANRICLNLPWRDEGLILVQWVHLVST